MLQLELLWEIQCIDNEINCISKEMKDKELYKKINEIKQNYSTVKKLLDVENFEVKKKNNEIKALNYELEQLDKKLNDDNKRLYQNGQSMKSIDNLQKEIEAYRLWIDKTENKLIYIMERNEKMAESVKQKYEMLESYKSEMESLRLRYIKDSEKWNEMLIDLNSKRESIKKEVDIRLMKQYDDIALKKHVAVSKVKDGNCVECGMKLNAMLYDRVKKGNNVCLCDNCGRILYME